MVMINVIMIAAQHSHAQGISGALADSSLNRRIDRASISLLHCYDSTFAAHTRSFVGGGFWEPNNEDLLRIRKELELDASDLREIIADETFKKFFGILEGEELKTAPKNFDKTHPNIDLIRKKQYLLTRKFTNAAVLSPNFKDEVIATFEAMRPFFNYMSDVLTTDLNGESLY